MDALEKYEESAKLYGVFLDAARIAGEKAEISRRELSLFDPHNPALTIPMREYALLKSQPVLMLAEILFGKGEDQGRKNISPQMAFLAASVAVGQGYSIDRILRVLERLFVRELERRV
ncbi:hypothetical protein [Thermosediminibacter litoriperuensis]|uniref:Uncharacterized protein n=1 Tax=Thermosediminibacter litoriperuensis TaxID=291989 RepID=A0A5S5AVC9_9FIRM|nr:hypothetical protein [Thermosediminibacter litoriperuensis]TYP56844.1 hypothetical protein LZ11_00907 [Thermosediminibacter litoriperuensis]